MTAAASGVTARKGAAPHRVAARPQRLSRTPSSEQGSASIYVLLIGVVLVAAALVLTALAGVVAARHRAESVADLAALAAAGRIGAGPTASCAAAASITARHGATLLACAAALDGSVRVEVGAPVRLGRLLGPAAGQSEPLMARGRARAG